MREKKFNPTASQIRTFIADTKFNGMSDLEAFNSIFFDMANLGDETKINRIKSMKKSLIYKEIDNSVSQGFYGQLREQAEQAGINYLKKYNSMLDEGDTFIRESEGSMKLKAFANQRALLESNPFAVIENLNAATKPKEEKQKDLLPTEIDGKVFID